MTEIPSLEALRQVTPPPVSAVHARVRQQAAHRRRLAVASAALAVAAGLLIAVVVRPGPTTRDRGLGAAPLVALEAVAEGTGAPRALGSEGAVAPDERVVFLARTDRPAWAVLREQDRVVWPTSGDWQVDGEAVVGGEIPLSWRPDGRSGPLRYELLACSSPEALASGGPGCATTTLTLRWSP
ncbi:MAG: hypothetical protein H6738_17265 [Alphaproteobacteria bacterium]|nr:hypothetical protein [Alphaproteobacteria bacterium]MCB9698535.1 hypothetical protein [Alphaproteobacteria bacterium]